MEKLFFWKRGKLFFATLFDPLGTEVFNSSFVLNAYDGMVNIKRLEDLAKQYGILDRMRNLYTEALETEDEG